MSSDDFEVAFLKMGHTASVQSTGHSQNDAIDQSFGELKDNEHKTYVHA